MSDNITFARKRLINENLLEENLNWDTLFVYLTAEIARDNILKTVAI